MPLQERTGLTKKFTDDTVCKLYLCGLSPYYLFKNTKRYSMTRATPVACTTVMRY